MYSKLQDLMEEKHFYSALKTLEQLEHIYLPRVRGYIFSEELAKEIPNMRESIENQSKSELKVQYNTACTCIYSSSSTCTCSTVQYYTLLIVRVVQYSTILFL